MYRTQHYLLLALLLITSLLRAAPAQAKDEPPPAFSQIERSDSKAICWRSANPVGVFAICVHGAGLDAQTFRGLSEQLSASGIDGVAIDWCADSLKEGSSPLHPDVIAETVHQIRNDFPKHRIWLVGESLGAVAALKFAVQHKAEVDGLVCSNIATRLAKQPLVLSEAIVETAIPFRRGLPFTVHRLARRALSSPSQRAIEKKLECCSRQLGIRSANSILDFMASAHEVDSAVQPMPILVIQGLRDRLVSKISVAKLVRHLPQHHLKFVLDADAGHLLLQENAASAKTVECLTNWLKAGASPQPALCEVISAHPLSHRELKLITKLRHGAGIEETEQSADSGLTTFNSTIARN